MDLKLCSFNCKGFNISKVKHIFELMKSCDILMLQETRALPSNVGKLNQYFVALNTYGISSVLTFYYQAALMEAAHFFIKSHCLLV